MLLLCAGTAAAQNDDGRAHFRIRYVINIPVIDTTFVDNNDRIADMRDFLEKAQKDSLLRFTSVKFKGTASPDGGYEFNRWLSAARLKSFKELVGGYIEVPDSIIDSNTSDIPWNEFRSEVEKSNVKYRDEILKVIDEGEAIVPWFNDRHIDARLLKLKKMHGGKAWASLKEPILSDLRYGDAVFEYYRVAPLVPLAAVAFPVSGVALPSLQGGQAPPHEDMWMPHVYLKTNLLGWGMLMANVACEVDIEPHWSFSLPIYYSAIDYFKSTIKFRNFTVQPEFRYWFWVKNEGPYYYNDGLFLGAHLGLSWYNFAFDGRRRYQDHRGGCPSPGGGLSLGYSLPVSRDHRWMMEFAVGAGIYYLDYDIFDNTPNVKDGQLTGRNIRTYIGLDGASVSLSYRFDWARRMHTFRKGGRK